MKKQPILARSIISDRGQMVVPKAIRNPMGIKARTEVEIRYDNGVATFKAKRDTSYLDAAMKKWGGKGRAKFLADGYKSVDQYIEEMRGR